MTIRRVGTPAAQPTPAVPAAAPQTNTAAARGANTVATRDGVDASASNAAAKALGTAAGAHTPLPSADLASPSVAVQPLPLTDPKAQSAIDASLTYLKGSESFAATGAGFKPAQAMVDDLGMTHVRLDRTQDGLRVFGEQVITHLDKDGKVIDATGEELAPLKLAPQATLAPALKADQALAKAQKDLTASFGGKDGTVTGQPELMYVKGEDGQYHKAFHLELTDLKNPDKPLRISYMIDAQTGKPLSKTNLIDGFHKPIADPVTVTGSAAPGAKINDNSTVTSKIHIDQDLDLTKLTADLDVKHSYRGDLLVTLTSPSGKSVTLSNREGGSADDIKKSFDLSAAFKGEKTVGDWTLSVSDKANQDTGTLNSWKLNLTGIPKAPPPPAPEGQIEIKKSAAPGSAITDNKTTTSTIQVDDEATIDDLKFSVDANHTYRGDLTAFLTAPDGTKVQLLNREGGSADDWKISDQDLAQFKGKPTKGTWTLSVTDNAAQDTGKLNSWSLDIKAHTGNTPPPPPPPPGEAGTGHSLYSGDVKLQSKQNADGTWSLIDDARSGGKTLDALNQEEATGDNEFHDKNNVWGEVSDDPREKAAIDAHYGMEQTWDFYKNVLGRTSIDGKGEALNSYVHLSNNYVNAYWDGKQMQYGDGDGQDAGPLTGLDIAGHEISHGLTERTANLVYSGESGGLNEAISDIMGKGVEWYTAQQNPNVHFSWSVGASVWTPNDNNPNDGLRYMNDPTTDGYSIDNYKNYSKSDKEVHRTSGIANNAFFLMVQGGKNRTSGLGVDASKAIGMDKSLKIMYRAESVYMTPNTTFAQASQAMIKAATDLYGANSQEVQTVTAAWKAVGVG